MGTSKIMVGLLLVGVSAASPAADNPYQAIVARNVFGLKDPPPPPPPGNDLPPPPKILLQGIATVLGKKQVLFRYTVPPKPPLTTGEVSLILGVGESQDEIKVIEIAEATGSVTFDNHGTIETKTLDKDSVKPVGTVPTIPGALGGNPLTVPRPAITTPGLQSIPTRPKAPQGVDSPIPAPPGAP